jgi:hypothetical protein
VSCRIVSSSVHSYIKKRGTSYGIDVAYKYTYNGRSYQSNRYQFLEVLSSKKADKQQVMDQLSPGSTVNCFVNPADPAQAVLVRDYTLGMFFSGGPMVLTGIVIGAIILRAYLRSHSK